MEDWRTLYQQKLTTAEEAVKHIKSGDRVVVTHATGEPILLTDAMVANAEQYENVEVVHMVAMGKAEYCLPENSKHFRHNSLFLGGMLSMSSTTIIIKAFEDLKMKGKRFTEMVFGILIVEDIAGIIMMVLGAICLFVNAQKRKEEDAE